MSDALEDLLKRNKRARVPERKDDLSYSPADNVTLEEVGAEEDDSLELDLKLSNGRTIRLLETVKNELRDYCYKNEITQDALFEAMFEILVNDTSKAGEAKVLELTRKKMQQRQSISLKKSADTRLKNIKSKTKKKSR